jgi:hypothetical protein
MSSSETAVREAAIKLHEAIVAAQAEGYRIDWPVNALGLPAIAISETGKMKPAALVEPAAAAKV